MQNRRVESLTAEVDRLRARSTLFRRFVCLLFRCRPWRTGLGGRAASGPLYSLVVCRRCGRRWAENTEAVAP